jgi:hypothetical protein
MEPASLRLEYDFCSNLRRILTCVASNVVGQRHRSIQALLTLASPSAQVTQALLLCTQSRSDSRFW